MSKATSYLHNSAPLGRYFELSSNPISFLWILICTYHCVNSPGNKGTCLGQLYSTSDCWLKYNPEKVILHSVGPLPAWLASPLRLHRQCVCMTRKVYLNFCSLLKEVSSQCFPTHLWLHYSWNCTDFQWTNCKLKFILKQYQVYGVMLKMSPCGQCLQQNSVILG